MVAAARRKNSTEREREGIKYQKMHRAALKLLAGSCEASEVEIHRDCSPEASAARWRSGAALRASVVLRGNGDEGLHVAANLVEESTRVEVPPSWSETLAGVLSAAAESGVVLQPSAVKEKGRGGVRRMRKV